MEEDKILHTTYSLITHLLHSNVGKPKKMGYFCSNSTRHATHLNSVPGRVFCFLGVSVLFFSDV